MKLKQMKSIRNNSLKKTYATAMLLVLLFAASVMMTIPTTQAQQAMTIKTYPLIDAIPNPVGVGQQVLIRFGISEALGVVNLGWTGITVTVVDPENITTTLGPFRTDSTGASFTIFTPEKVGNYTLTTNFPQQNVTETWVAAERGVPILAGTVMLASSISMQLVVQEEPLPNYPDLPLPTEYWTRPIDPQLRSWYSISGNWVERPPNSYSSYNDEAPETAHVLWAKPMTIGGLTGGLWGDGQVPASAETGDAYEGKFQNSVVMYGVLYYNVNPAGFGGPTETPGVRAVDLHTGKELWFRNNTNINFGQILYFNSFNTDGVFEYLWTVTGNTWTAMDPFTGEWIFTMTDVPSGVQVRGPSGEILRYVFGPNNRWLALWNSTDAGETLATGFSGGSWGNVVHKRTVNASVPGAYSWNVSLPAGLTYNASFGAPTLRAYPGDRIVAVTYNQTQVRVWGINLNSSSAARGTLLFDKTWAAPSEWLEGFNTLHYGGASDNTVGGIISVWSKELTTHYGFSTEDGSYRWATEPEIWLDLYGWGNAEHTWYFAYNKLYSVGVGGIVYAYDMATGETVWTYEMLDAYNEPVTGSRWWGWITNIADDKVYVGTVEHSAEQPLPRGAPFICLNATTGAEIWRINGMFRATRWGGNAVMGDSIIATMDTYDQRIYAVGRGPSKTTITVNTGALQLDSGVIIQGYVTDISPGTQDAGLMMQFPNGVPVVNDDSMSEWMLRVYKQFPTHMNATGTGVPVSLDVMDANGNFRNIGTATTDATGSFTFTWTPDITGNYQVYATFQGTNGYWPSHAQTSFNVMEAGATPTVGPGGPTGNLEMTVWYAAIAIIIVVIIVGAVVALTTRRH